MHTRLFAVMATMGLVLFALGPGAATAAAAAGNTAGNDSLDVSVDQTDEEPTVTVTDNDTAVENATVTVENATVTVAVLDNGTYEGADETYSTDANGTVVLPEPEANVSVEVTATAGNATGSTTADLTVASETESFGNNVSAFVQSLISGNATGIGQQVAEFATSNNPGNAPEWAGPPADGERGPPEHADTDDNETEDRRGPPAHAGPSDDSDDNETEDTDDEAGEETDDDDSDDSDDSGGPPEQARGNGNGN